MAKHEAVVAWEKWLKVPDGAEISKGKSEGIFLENRLWCAFMAGWDAAETRSQPPEPARKQSTPVQVTACCTNAKFVPCGGILTCESCGSSAVDIFGESNQ